MSPRSEEFAAEARERLAAGQDALDDGHNGVAVGCAYYAMLYAARAVLSERDLNARTHRGSWSLFSEHFVKTGIIDQQLMKRARHVERVRYEADYDAADVDHEQATTLLADAERFVEDVLATLD